MKKDASGRRSVEVEVEVPGTPEEVWQAIATGPGVSAWFVPTEVDGRDGGTFVFHMGPGMDNTATITGWEPPHRFSVTESDWLPTAPPIATEWVVESKSGDTCTVRVVHSLFASDDDWDDQLKSMESGWPGFFRILRIYLTSFKGQPSANVSAMTAVPGSEADAWSALAEALGLTNATPGEHRSTPAGAAPPLAGTVERMREGSHPHEVLLRLDEPAPGAAAIGAYVWSASTHVAFNIFFYGDTAAETAAREEPRWREWLAQRFPAAGSAGASSTT